MIVNPHQNYAIHNAVGMYETMCFILCFDSNKEITWTFKNNELWYTLWDSEQACEIHKRFFNLNKVFG